MNQQRRIVLKRLLVGGVSLLALGGSAQTWAIWPEKAFTADNLEDALQALFGGEGAEPSEAIQLKIPEVAENGAVVPVSVKTDLEKVASITILVENNPSPLAASFTLPAEAIADVSTRIKMGKTSRVIALVRADGGLYATHQEVKVTIGGCGG